MAVADQQLGGFVVGGLDCHQPFDGKGNAVPFDGRGVVHTSFGIPFVVVGHNCLVIGGVGQFHCPALAALVQPGAGIGGHSLVQAVAWGRFAGRFAGLISGRAAGSRRDFQPGQQASVHQFSPPFVALAFAHSHLPRLPERGHHPGLKAQGLAAADGQAHKGVPAGVVGQGVVGESQHSLQAGVVPVQPQAAFGGGQTQEPPRFLGQFGCQLAQGGGWPVGPSQLLQIAGGHFQGQGQVAQGIGQPGGFFGVALHRLSGQRAARCQHFQAGGGVQQGHISGGRAQIVGYPGPAGGEQAAAGGGQGVPKGAGVGRVPAVVQNQQRAASLPKGGQGTAVLLWAGQPQRAATQGGDETGQFGQ